ncbi:uncharacterized protein BDZ99DRAFT_528086 [Mytilinidion resinicola]|uniref:Ankyrin n=1 Tax=Mytilinidion resinicola TaxID=574789 RepID=A0A6A6Y1I7_9PEZI|nr:uncharacterized protein BDZ99DRAFT_528086 [Mytilinidion resinicola]KAF2801874.1 hypothetical protein BDZ99DRAFT_528086 [Mytilinidion resinicola]
MRWLRPLSWVCSKLVQSLSREIEVYLHPPRELQGQIFGCPIKAAAKQEHYHILEFLLGNIDFSGSGPLWSHHILDILNTAAETSNDKLPRVAYYSANPKCPIVPRAWVGKNEECSAKLPESNVPPSFNGMSGRDVFIQLWHLPSPFEDLKTKALFKLYPVHFSYFINCTTAIIKYLLQPRDSRSFEEQNRNIMNRDEEPTPLHLQHTISKGQLVKTRLLLDHGLKLEPGKRKYTYKADCITCIVVPTPRIIFAVLLERTDFFHLLRQHGAVLGSRRAGGLALRLAAEEGLKSMVRLLLEDGIPVFGASCGLSPFGPFKGAGNKKALTYIGHGVRRLLVDVGGLNRTDDMTDRISPICES